MPTPDIGTEFIEISDFSPGIVSDQHGSLAPRFTASETTKGALLGNGIARADGTSRCRADKTGALIPLPRAQPTGTRDLRVPWGGFVDINRPHRYILDAQVGNVLVDATETGSAAFDFEPRFPVQVMFGYFRAFGAVHTTTVVGREYRPWRVYPTFTTTLQPAVDFMLGVTEPIDLAAAVAKIPIGSLARARFYFGGMSAAFTARAYAVVAATDIFTIAGGHSFLWDDRVVLSNVAGGTGIVAGTTYFVRDVTATTFKLAATQGGAAINITTDGTGNAAFVDTTSFRPHWAYPVSVAMAATPFVRWGNGNYFSTGAGTFWVNDEPAQFGFTTDVADPMVRYPPAIGFNGKGTTLLAMQLHDGYSAITLPFPTSTDRWYYHYSERGNVPDNDLLEDIAGGPINPYMLVAHQGRVAFPDRRRTKAAYTSRSGTVDHGYANDLLFYSPFQLPTSDTAVTALTTDKGIAGTVYGEWPQTTQERYSTLEVAMDSVSDVGTLGVVSVDQLLLVKHFGGGALIAGDLDNPSIHRLPYIESTSGLICKGVLSPIGFVYGSPRGIFVWNGGDSTQKLSPQLDGFFWNHTDSDLNGPLSGEQYAGSRGRMGYWNGLVCVPNNYVFDIETQSWWRLQTKTVHQQGYSPVVNSPYNCYDVDERGVLYAFPYRHHAVTFVESHFIFPEASAPATQLNCLSIPDNANFSAPSQLDIRMAVSSIQDGVLNADKTLISHYQTTGDQRAFLLRTNAADELQFLTSTDGTAGTVIVATATVARTITTLAGIRATWRASDGRVQFFYKNIGQDVKSALRANTGWVQIGIDRVAAVAALHNSTENLVVGNLGDDTLSNPLGGNGGAGYNPRVYGVWLNTTIDGATPIFEIAPDDIPADTAPNFVCESGQTVTITRAVSGSKLESHPLETPEPVWYTFEQDDLDTAYTWNSHPLVQTRGRVLSFQSIELLATALTRVGGTDSTIAVELSGFTESGTPVTPVTTTFTLANTDQPQLLREDISPNFLAEYVTVKITSTGGGSPTQVPAPKIHRVQLATKPRAKTPRHG